MEKVFVYKRLTTLRILTSIARHCLYSILLYGTVSHNKYDRSFDYLEALRNINNYNNSKSTIDEIKMKNQLNFENHLGKKKLSYFEYIIRDRKYERSVTTNYRNLKERKKRRKKIFQLKSVRH